MTTDADVNNNAAAITEFGTNADFTADADAAYEEAMDDVHSRFILNLPPEELGTSDRIFFQLEQAWWFYDDFLCDGQQQAQQQALQRSQPPPPPLRRYKHLKPFSLAMFQFSPLLRPMLPRFESMYAEFSAYRRTISTYGTILLNADATEIALCRMYQGKAWTVPGGKVNQNERGKDAAARETYEETGFDPWSERGLCGVWKKERRDAATNTGGGGERQILRRLRGESNDSGEGGENDNIVDDDSFLPWEPALLDSNKLVYTEHDTEKRRTCYVCRGVPTEFPFAPVVRKEISEVAWHGLDKLPKHTFAVLPFLSQLRKWIKRDNKRRAAAAAASDGGEGDAVGDGSKSTPRAGSRSGSRPKGAVAGGETPQHKRKNNSRPKRRGSHGAANANAVGTGANNVDADARDPNAGASTPAAVSGSRRRGSSSKRSNSRGKKKIRTASEDDPLVACALVCPGEKTRWTENEMFAANERLLGRKIEYDGNPHVFAERGFVGGVDPHAFRVVGGNFMNASGVGVGQAGAGGNAEDGREDGRTAALLAPPPDASALQPLLLARDRSGSRGSSGSGDRDGGGGDRDLVLTPFFSQDGKAPWEGEGCATNDPGGSEPALPWVNPLRQPVLEGDHDGGSGGSGKVGSVDRNSTSPLSLPVRSAADNDTADCSGSGSGSGTGSGVGGGGGTRRSNSKGLALLSRLRMGNPAMSVDEGDDDEESATLPRIVGFGMGEGCRGGGGKEAANDASLLSSTDWFLTDEEVTARSQREKLGILPPPPEEEAEGDGVTGRKSDLGILPPAPAESDVVPEDFVPRSASSYGTVAQDGGNGVYLEWMKDWVKGLPQAQSTKEFGIFRFDVDAIMQAMVIRS